MELGIRIGDVCNYLHVQRILHPTQYLKITTVCSEKSHSFSLFTFYRYCICCFKKGKYYDGGNKLLINFQTKLVSLEIRSLREVFQTHLPPPRTRHLYVNYSLQSKTSLFMFMMWYSNMSSTIGPLSIMQDTQLVIEVVILFFTTIKISLVPLKVK